MKKKILILACLALLGVGGMQAQNPFKLLKMSKEEVKKFTESNFSESDAKKIQAMVEDDGTITEEEETRSENDARREMQKTFTELGKERG